MNMNDTQAGYLDQEDRYKEFKQIVTTQRENVRALNAVFRMTVEKMDNGDLTSYEYNILPLQRKKWLT